MSFLEVFLSLPVLSFFAADEPEFLLDVEYQPEPLKCTAKALISFSPFLLQSGQGPGLSLKPCINSYVSVSQALTLHLYS